MSRCAAILLLPALAACSMAVTSEESADKHGPPGLVAARTSGDAMTPAMNAAWNGAAPVNIPTHFKAGLAGPTVELRALHDGEFLYLMARWPDETRSDAKKAWQYKEGGWARLKGDEDRFAVAINHNVPGFAESGCTALCHEGSMGTLHDTHTADLWHWKAARGGQAGWCDDQNFRFAEVGRGDDSGRSAYQDNTGQGGSAPRWVWADHADRNGAFDESAAREMPDGFTPPDGYSVPSIRLRAPEQSRADVTAASRWQGGWWTIVLKRRLETGNSDDAPLKPGHATHIAIATFDDTGASLGHEHAKSGAIKLTLE